MPALTEEQAQPRVKVLGDKPPGVISKRAQQYLFVAIAIVILLVAMFSSKRQPKPVSKAEAAVPAIQDVNERKLADYGSDLAEQQRVAERARAATELPPPS